MSVPGGASLDISFRQAFRRHALGVTVLTYRDAEGHPRGMTATSVCSVSADPPQLLACINRRGRTRDAILASGRFAVNILAESHRAVSEMCARPGPQKALLGEWVADGSTAVPVIRESLANFECAVVHVYEESTHSICIGRILAISLGAPSNPLVYFDGAYHTLARLAEEKQAAPSYEALLQDMISAYS